MEFQIGQLVRLLNKPDPAWFDPSTMPAQDNFLALPLDIVFRNKVKAKKLRVGKHGSVGEIVAVDPNTSLLHIKFKEAELDDVPFGCCVVVHDHKSLTPAPEEVDDTLIEQDEE